VSREQWVVKETRTDTDRPGYYKKWYFIFILRVPLLCRNYPGLNYFFGGVGFGAALALDAADPAALFSAGITYAEYGSSTVGAFPGII
jgi:hypothetical protein